MSRVVCKVVCGISGGVDSAVSAYLLKQKGFHVVGAFMTNWDKRNEADSDCVADKDRQDATRICRILDIELSEVNFVREYWNEVFMDTISSFTSGRTPNPDVRCNSRIKFAHFYRYCLETLGADAVATGHYANTSFGPYLEHHDETQDVRLMTATDVYKDQTFFLSAIDSGCLRRSMFPLAHLIKDDVRDIASQAGLSFLNEKKESMGLCFVGKRRNFDDFLDKYIEPSVGNFIHIDTGEIIGQHQGIHHYTLGKAVRVDYVRRGMNVCSLHVVSKDSVTGNIFVCDKSSHPALYQRRAFLQNVHWISGEWPAGLVDVDSPLELDFRYQHGVPSVPSKVNRRSDGELEVNFSKPLKCVAPGQIGVLYDGMYCLGCGEIYKSDLSLHDGDYCVNEK